MKDLFEVKFQIEPGEEERIVLQLGLELTREYSDTDTFLTGDGDTLKIKEVGNDTILYELAVKEPSKVFHIRGRNISDEEKSEILKLHPIEQVLHRTKKAYDWDNFNVRCAFDYIDELPGRVFFEVYANDESTVLKAKEHIIGQGYEQIVDQPYNQLFT